ncbi:MAG: hypothetical protein LBR49_05290 [Tannerella sp.]|nr:hypothetical protein [Tannerella sp.]
MQIAYLLADAQTVEREYTPLEIIPDNYEKMLIAMDDVRFPSRNGIIHNQIWNIKL